MSVTGRDLADVTSSVDVSTQAAAELAWSLDELPDIEQGNSWRRATRLAAGIAMVSMAIAGATLLVGQHSVLRRDNHAKPLPAIATTTASPAPLPLAVPRLDGIYRIVHDWDHQTYRTNGAVHWTRDGETQTVWWAFATTCSAQNDCVATGVELDGDDHQKIAVPSGTDVLKLVNGIWQDMTPEHIQAVCTHISDGKAVKFWSTIGWRLEPLPDGTFHGELTQSVDTDDCGNKGDTAVLPITATWLGPVPARVLPGGS